MKEKNIPVIGVSKGMYWRAGNSLFYIVAPEKFVEASNDASVVILAEIGGKRWLFTGDLEKEGENRLIDDYKSLQVDVLKVGHHGSNTSTTPPFLNSLNPKVALISAGRNNRYGHPHQEVVDTLEKNGVIVYRTDQNGAITYSFFFNQGVFSPVIQ